MIIDKHLIFNYLYRGKTRTKYLSLTEVAELIASKKYSSGVTALREILQSGTNLNGTVIPEAQRLPAVCFAQSQEGYTGLVTLTFRGRDEQLQNYMKVAFGLPQTLLAFRGSSGNTLKIVVKCTYADGTLPSDEDEVKEFHRKAFDKVAKYYKSEFYVDPSMKGSSPVYGVRMSADRAAYFNPGSININVLPDDTLSISKLKKLALKMDKDARTREEEMRRHRFDLPLYNRDVMQMTRFQFCLENALNEDNQSMDLFFVTLAKHCQANNLGMEFCIMRLLHFDRFKDYEILIRECFKNQYNSDNALKEQSVPPFIIAMENMKAYLQERFRFRRNNLTGVVEYMDVARRVYDWKPLDRRVICSITMDLHSAGVDIWDKDVKRYVDSTYIEEFEPIKDYLKSLPLWDGTERIETFARRIPTDFGLWPKYFHLWFRAMVAQWIGMNDMHGQSMMPLLIGNQGDGKSTFCKMILPKALKDFYTDRIDFTNRNDAEKYLSRFLLINVDEFDSITKNQNAFLKHILQKSEVKGRKPYGSVIVETPRYASFIGTTNDMTPLTDITGSRRFLCVQSLSTIDTITPVENEMMLSQAIWELQKGERFFFNRDEEREIQEHNSKFQMLFNVDEILMACFSRPVREDEGLWFSASEVHSRLHDFSKIIKMDKNVTVQIGKALVRHGFKQRRTHTGNKYLMVRREQ